MSIRFERVTKTFGKTVLREVSFEASTGEILFIIGKSGVGKSVTLKHIVGVMKPDSGRVLVEGEDVTAMNDAQLSEIRRKCGMVFQHPALLDSLTVEQNVSFGLRTPQYVRGLPRPLDEGEIRKIVIDTLSLVNLRPEILEKFPPELSYGTQKRVSLARTLAPHPSYLLFDEPTTGLDPITTNAINDLIFDLSRKLKVTSIVVSHDMACALKIADRIMMLDQASILALDTTDKIKKSDEPLIRSFLEETLALLPPEEREGK